MQNLFVFHINLLVLFLDLQYSESDFFPYSNLSGILYSSVSYFGGNIQEEKTIFEMAKSITKCNILNGK